MAKSQQDKASYWAIVPAAGSGTRMGTALPKQYLPLHDKTVLEHTLDALLACAPLTGVVVAVAADDPHWPVIEARYRKHNVRTVTGGAERCHSVLNALDYLAAHGGENDRVLVHDAARPCVRGGDIERLIDAVGDDDNGGLLAVPLTDTVKRSDPVQRVADTVDRRTLWRALTPQLFHLDLLTAALASALDDGVPVTDDAAAMEHAGYRPLLVQGATDNIKVTMAEDLELAAWYLRRRRAG